MELNLGFLFALVAALSYAILSITEKYLGSKLSDEKSTVLFSVFISLFSFIAVLISKSTLYIETKFIFVILASSFLGFLGLLYLFKSFNYLPVGYILLIANSYPLIMYFTSFFIIKESFNYLIIPISIFLLCGIGLVIKFQKVKKSKYLYLPFMTMLGWGAFSTGNAYLVKSGIAPQISTFYLEFTILVYASFYLFVIRGEFLNKEELKSSLKIAFFSGFLAFLSTLSLANAFRYASLPLVSSIAVTDLAFAPILSYFIFKEKLKKYQILGIAMVMLSLVLFYNI